MFYIWLLYSELFVPTVVIIRLCYTPLLFIFQEFFASRTVPAAERTIQQSLENIRLNCTWLARESDRIRSWLQDKGY